MSISIGWWGADGSPYNNGKQYLEQQEYLLERPERRKITKFYLSAGTTTTTTDPTQSGSSIPFKASSKSSEWMPGQQEKNMCIPLPATAAAAVTGNLLLPRANKVVGMIKTHTTGSVYDWRNWDEQFSGNFADDKCIQFLVTIIQFLHISGGGIKFRSRGARNTTDAAVNGKLSFYVRR